MTTTTKFLTAFIIAAALAVLAACQPAEPPLPPPPETAVETVTETLHGDEIADDYRWLEDQEAQPTRDWIDAQNAYTDELLGARPGRDELEARVTELLKIDSVGIPRAAGGRYFLSKRGADQDLSVIYVRDSLDGEDRVLLDPHTMSDDGSISVNLLDVAEDGSHIVYALRSGGQDEVEVRMMNVDTGEDLADVMPTSRYFGASLTPDMKQLYYTQYDANGPRIYRHTVGNDPANAELIFGENLNAGHIAYGSLSQDGRYLVAHVLEGSAGEQTQLYLRDLERGRSFVPVATDIKATFTAGVIDGRLYAQTNWNAPNGRVMVGDASNPGAGTWKELIPERDNAVIRGFSAVGGKLVVNYLEDVKSRVLIFDTEGNELGEIAFDTIGNVGGVIGRWDSDEAFFTFTSFHVPTTIYRYDMATDERSEWYQIEIPVETDQIEVQQVKFASKDGVEVPMFLVHKNGLALDGTNPTYLTGYGGFRVSRTPGFSAFAAAWVEMGGVYALPNLRGGGEYGEKWHKAGMLAEKQNTFDDFIAAGEWLIDNGYTSKDKLAIAGGSNGGLLVGAALTQRPDLFRAVICSYPLLDMLRYHHFLVARFWVPEYGSSEDPDQYQVLKAYSPYHNANEGVTYPAQLYVTGDGDTRVAPLHARKMAALMQTYVTDNRPVMLRYHTKQGHAGGTPVSQRIEDMVDTISFLRWQLGEE